MKHGGWWWGLAILVACGHELELPAQPETGGAASRSGPTSGVTGAEAGAPDEGKPPERLPVSDTPLFGPGGAGGDDSAADGGTGARGGKGGTGSAGSGGNSSGQAGKPAGEGGVGGAGEPPTPPALLFSEYVEGSGSFKALELFAISTSSLEGCDLETYFNGKLEPSRLALHGEVSAGQTYVLCSSALAMAQPASCDRSTNLTFNGDDALALTCSGVVLDVIGQIGVDPGVAWGAGATADHTLRRNCAVTSGRSAGSEPFEPALQWSSLDSDVFDGLGQRGCDDGDENGGGAGVTPG